MDAMEVGPTAAVRIQSLFRGVNERIRELSQIERPEFLCECVDGLCAESIVVPVEEYDRVRLVPTHFIVRPGHVAADLERVVATSDTFVVVEKYGIAGTAAIELDPRRRSLPTPP